MAGTSERAMLTMFISSIPINRVFLSLLKINHNMQMTIDCVMERQKCRHCHCNENTQPANASNKFEIYRINFLCLIPSSPFVAFRWSSVFSLQTKHEKKKKKPKQQLARRFPKTYDPGHKYFMMK